MGNESAEGARAEVALNVLLGEKVLGLKVYSWLKYSNSQKDLDPCLIKESGGLTVNRKGGPHGQGWSPCEYIADAMEVAEALRAQGFLYRIQRFPVEFKSGVEPRDGMKGLSYCQFYGGSLGLQFDAVAASPEMAICRAAERLVKHQFPKKNDTAPRGKDRRSDCLSQKC